MERNHYLLLSDFLLPRWESPLIPSFVSNASSHPETLQAQFGFVAIRSPLQNLHSWGISTIVSGTMLGIDLA